MKHTSCPHQIRLSAVSLVVALSVWLATIALLSLKPGTRGIDIAAGSGTFRDHCGACHVMEKGISTHHGPNLFDFGRIAGTRKPGMTAAEYILESVLDPDAFVAPVNRRGMPRNRASMLTDDEIRNVVAYLVSRGGSPDYSEIRGLTIPDRSRDTEIRTVRREDMELADRVLRGRGACLQCHSFFRNAEYTVFAPGLFGVGLSDEQLLRESIIDPSKTVSPYHRWINVSLANGQIATGKLIQQTDERLVLLTRGSANDLVQVDIPLSDVDTDEGKPLIQPSELSPMPTGLDKLLSERELDALITMIRQLN